MTNKPPAEALKELQSESEKLGLYEDEAVEGKELKACPFCGGTMQMGIYKTGLGVHQRTSYYANCSFDDCGCELKGQSTEAEAIAVCNTRANSNSVLDRVLEEFGKFVEDDSKVFTNGGTRYTPGIHSSYRVLKQIITKLKGE